MGLSDLNWDDANLPKAFFASVAQYNKKPFLYDKKTR